MDLVWISDNEFGRNNPSAFSALKFCFFALHFRTTAMKIFLCRVI